MVGTQDHGVAAIEHKCDAAIAPRVVKELLSEGIDLQAARPRLVTAADVASASRIVTFGCDLEALRPHVPVDRWDDVPAVSDDYATALDLSSTSSPRQPHRWCR